MKFVRPLVAAALAGAAMLKPLMAHAQASDKWEIGAAVYVYLPTISGKTTFPATGGGSSVSIDAETILENLKMTFMGTLEASNGTWGAFTDLVYIDVGDSKSGTQSFSIGSPGVPDKNQFKLIKVGDQVQATYTEAVAVSMEPAKK